MTNRKYFTDPVKALFMMREFDVKITQRCSDPGQPFATVDISTEEMIKDLQYWNPRYEKENRLYVAEESEHIFKPKHFDMNGSGDMYIERELDDKWVSTLREYNHSYLSKIIMRDNKHFFDCEVEND